MLFFFFFFKQKTAYEMRISDWSSDVCSSDLEQLDTVGGVGEQQLARDVIVQVVEVRRDLTAANEVERAAQFADDGEHPRQQFALFGDEEIGRASCRERVCQYG